MTCVAKLYQLASEAEPFRHMARCVHQVRRADSMNPRFSVFVAAFALPSIFVHTACTSSETPVTTAPTPPRCAVTVGNTNASFTSAGGNGTINVSTTRDCTWTVAPEASWVTIGGDRSGQGDAAIPYAVAPNPVPSPRSGDIA